MLSSDQTSDPTSQNVPLLGTLTSTPTPAVVEENATSKRLPQKKAATSSTGDTKGKH